MIILISFLVSYPAVGSTSTQQLGTNVYIRWVQPYPAAGCESASVIVPSNRASAFDKYCYLHPPMLH